MDNLTPITREEMLMNDEPLTPITREEKILAGEDLTPVTRREYFLKKYRHADGDVMVEGLSVTENGIYTAPEGKAYSPVEVAVPMPENAYLLKTASGSLVSFSDGADLPMPSFVCDIDAQQDLHGYDAPWAGGAGKNKINLADIVVPSAGFVYNREPANIAVNTYTLSFNFIGSSGSISISLRNGETIVSTLQDQPLVNGLNTFTMPTLSNNADSISLYSGVNGTYENFMLEIGTQATTYEPYSNICPISGHTGVEAVISPTTETSAGTTYSVSWQTEAGEVYGGEIDLVSGVLTVTDGYIASYDGEILPSTWISDSDVYAEGTTPTTGAEVVYKLAEAQTYQLTPTQIKSLLGNNNAWCDTGDVTLEYFGKGDA